MRWTRYIIGSAAIGLTAIIANIPNMALADTIIIKYDGPNAQQYKPGAKLLADTSIILAPSEVLTILDERGTRILRGPGKFNSSSPSNTIISQTSLSKLIKTSTVRRARTGAVRGNAPATTETKNPNLWFIDIAHAGTYCVADFDSLQLWRANPEKTQQITTTNTASHSYAPVQFHKGQTSSRWPASVPPVDGGNYTINGGETGDITTIKLAKVEITGEESLDLIATKLFEKGCRLQGELLAATFAQEEPAADAG